MGGAGETTALVCIPNQGGQKEKRFSDQPGRASVGGEAPGSLNTSSAPPRLYFAIVLLLLICGAVKFRGEANAHGVIPAWASGKPGTRREAHKDLSRNSAQSQLSDRKQNNCRSISRDAGTLVATCGGLLP